MLVEYVKFPPVGDRGLDGASFDSDFLLSWGENYTEEANRETFLVVQIETPQAVESVGEIAAVPGLDGLFIGPGGLGMRIARNKPELTLEPAVAMRAADAVRLGEARGA